MEFDISHLEKLFNPIDGLKYAYLKGSPSELNLKIYRYIDLLTFLQISGQHRFYVSRKKEFPDLFEKGYAISSKYLMFHFAPVGEKNLEQYKDIWDKNDKNKSLIETVPVSCWTLKEDEDYYAWKANNKVPITIRIETTVGDLLKAFDTKTKIFAGKVIYKDSARGSPDYMSLYSKRKSYQCEEEYRFCFPEKSTDKKENTTSGIYISLKSTDWIKSINISTLGDYELANAFCSFIKNNTEFKDIVTKTDFHEENKDINK